MNAKEIKFEDINQVKKLSDQMDLYRQEKGLLSDSLFSLVDASIFAGQQNKSGFMWTLLFDIYLYATELELGIHEISSIYNDDIKNTQKHAISIFNSINFFEQRMELHRIATEFTLRYRAAWDKLLGLMILIYSPDEYDKFQKSKEKLKSFNKIAKEWHFEDTTDITMQISEFNNKFRTAEAHNSGVWRKWAFVIQNGVDDPREELMDAFNEFLDNLHIIKFIIKLSLIHGS